MKRIYFVSNNLMSSLNVVYPQEISFYEIREKTMLSKRGDLSALKLLKMKDLESVERIYSSSYTSALMTSKYIAEDKNLNVFVDERLNERIVGDLGSNEYRFLKGMQEHDFNYKLNHGESIKDVHKRMTSFLKMLLERQEKSILVFTHNIALMSLCLSWCPKDYNAEDRLVLASDDEVLFDGFFHDLDLIEVCYDDSQKLKSIHRIL